MSNKCLLKDCVVEDLKGEIFYEGFRWTTLYDNGCLEEKYQDIQSRR